MIRLGLSISLRGGRESIVRLVLITLGVAVGACLLLFMLAGFSGLHNQDKRYAWLTSSADNRRPSVQEADSDPLYWRSSQGNFGSHAIQRVDVAATGPHSPVPPGMDRLPGPGQYYVSPALAELMRKTPPDQLADRFSGTQAGIIGDKGLTSPDALIAVVGHEPSELKDLRFTETIRSIETAPRQRRYLLFLRVVLGIGAIGLLFPVLVFIATTTRLSAARREQRFASLRFVGATPGQIGAIAAVEAGLAATIGVLVGFTFFWLLRPAAARIPLTGDPFFTADLSPGVLSVLLVLIGVPLCAAFASLLSLSRVKITPLGVARSAVPKRARARRAIPLVAGICLLVVLIFLRPGSDSTKGQTVWIVALLSAFVLCLVGLVIAGPWLTRIGTRMVAGRTRRVAGLLAGRRLADDPSRAFRSISGVILAVFLATVFIGMAGTYVKRAGLDKKYVLPESVVTGYFSNGEVAGLPSDKGAALVGRLQTLEGARLVVPVYAPPDGPSRTLGKAGSEKDSSSQGMGLVSEEDVARLPELGKVKGATPGGVVEVKATSLVLGEALNDKTCRPSPVSAGELGNLPRQAVLVATDGRAASVERARTAIDQADPLHPRIDNMELEAVNEVTTMADLAILVTLIIAGCSLAVAVAGSLVERKRPFTLLRVAGVRLKDLRRVVLLEAAIPLVVVTVFSAGIGILTADLVLKALNRGGLNFGIYSYYVVLLASIVVALLLVVATLPLLKKMTDPENVRFE